ncbi:toll/interleukin-1 receptor domain-containing protein [Micromonospora zamorensis]|uniref:toll/interleukin-1 receptor domain-containing protein n=1 Tax=Micromonospora zamorensis TaxID=709883 RepID=UPI003715357B
MPDIFLSYSRRNRRFIDRLVADLEDHGIEVWQDVLELGVGDPVHKSIESAISESRFFCLALSPAALRSYYVRDVEFEQAFSRSLRERRDLILPIVVQKLDVDGPAIPERIRHLHRLDFSVRRNYAENVRKLVQKVRGVNTHFSGERWYKGLNISNLGEPVGVGPTAQMATLGPSYRMVWHDGTVTRVDVFINGTLAHYKEFEFDSGGRVVTNTMYTPDGSGGWELRDDVWYYSYDPVTGSRATKAMRYPGENTARVVEYGKDGRALREYITTEDGERPDRQFPYSSKVFRYDQDGNVLGEDWFDDGGAPIPSSV